ncbi:MAG: protein phosphatase 2C domain-containing protein [Candidatus Cloacimonetes bacterium]|nr:protein phosphatase 2C domain-containing protein [Candidatus Cloacimonadota bacterium]
MNLNYYGISAKGKKSPENEDNFLLPIKNDVYKLVPDTKNKGHLFLLCDGMGGSRAGEVASQLCCGWFFKEYYDNSEEIEDIHRWMEEEIDSLNNRLFQLSEEYAEYNGMGTTLVNLLIKDDIAYFNNVGDSRLYLFRNNELKQLTEDDSEVWKLYKAGLITKDEILINPRKNIITRAIATRSFIEVHKYTEIKTKSRDIFILCSDGLTDFVKDSEIAEILKSKINIVEKTKTLLKIAKENKTNDDTTIIGVLVE